MPSEPNSGPDPEYSVEVNPEGVRAKRPEGEHADSVTPWGEPADAAPTSGQPSDTIPANPSPADPNFLGMAVSAAKSMAQFAASGFKRVSPEDHELRLEQCSQCSQLDGSRCKLCRCFADKKAWLPHEDCPLGKWPL